MRKGKLTVPLMERAGYGTQNLNGTCVNVRSRELLLEIWTLLDVFAPAGDEKIQIKDTEFMPANEAMLAILRMFAKEVVE